MDAIKRFHKCYNGYAVIIYQHGNVANNAQLHFHTDDSKPKTITGDHYYYYTKFNLDEVVYDQLNDVYPKLLKKIPRDDIFNPTQSAGWIDLNGNFYSCHNTEHRYLARRLFYNNQVKNVNNIDITSEWACDQELIDLGWIKIMFTYRLTTELVCHEWAWEKLPKKQLKLIYDLILMKPDLLLKMNSCTLTANEIEPFL